MARLIEATPCQGLLPLQLGGVTLAELPAVRITSVAPFNGKERAVAAALKALGLGWPAPGRMLAKGGTGCIWTGRGQAMLIGADPEALAGIAALTDQSDGWARVRLDGARAGDVLARLVPLDLSAQAFATGQSARTSLGHMMVILSRPDPAGFELMVLRSMSVTAVHELETAMKSVAARQLVSER